jgi:hypothetical protein
MRESVQRLENEESLKAKINAIGAAAVFAIVVVIESPSNPAGSD